MKPLFFFTVGVCSFIGLTMAANSFAAEVNFSSISNSPNNKNHDPRLCATAHKARSIWNGPDNLESEIDSCTGEPAIQNIFTDVLYLDKTLQKTTNEHERWPSWQAQPVTFSKRGRYPV